MADCPVTWSHGGSEPGHDRAPTGGQVRRAPRPARRCRAADPGRAGVREHQPARHRAELRVLARRAALLLRRQVRSDHVLRPAVQGRVRHQVRPYRGDRRRGGAAPPRVRRGDGGDAGRGREPAPALVRPAQPVPVRREVPGRRQGHRPVA